MTLVLLVALAASFSALAAVENWCDLVDDQVCRSESPGLLFHTFPLKHLCANDCA